VYAVLASGDKVIASGRKASDRLQAQKDAGAARLALDITLPRLDLDATINEALKI